MAINPLFVKALEIERELALPPGTAYTLINAESSGNPTAKSKAGAIGLTQLLPSTAKELGVDPNDPEQNIRGGLTYFKRQLDKFGDPQLAAAAYNAGPNNRALVSNKINQLPLETQAYMKKFSNLQYKPAQMVNLPNFNQAEEISDEEAVALGIIPAPQTNDQAEEISDEEAVALGIIPAPTENKITPVTQQTQTSETSQPEMSWLESVGQGAVNFIPSAAQATKDFASAIWNAPETAERLSAAAIDGVRSIPGIGPLLKQADKSLVEQLPKVYQDYFNSFQDPEQAFNAFVEDYKQAYGGEQNIKQTIAQDPARVLLDIFPFARPAAGLVRRAATEPLSNLSASIAARRSPNISGILGNEFTVRGTPEQVQEAVQSVQRARKLPNEVFNAAEQAGNILMQPSQVLKAVTERVVPKTAGKTLGLLSGIDESAISQAYRAGRSTQGLLDISPSSAQAQAFTEQMRGRGSNLAVVDDALTALDQMRNQMSAQYRQGMSQVAESTKPIDFAPIKQSVNQAFDVKKFKDMELSPSTANVKRELSQIVNEWEKLNPAEYHTAMGLDALKQRVGDLLNTLPFESRAERAVVNQVYNTIKNEITKEAPTYARVMNEYSNNIKNIDTIRKELSLNPNANPLTALRKLQSSMRDNAATGWGARGQLLEQLEQQVPNITSQLAGQALSSLAPRGLQRSLLPTVGAGAVLTGAVDPVTAALAGSLTSPRLIGEASYLLGKGGANVGQFYDLLNQIDQIPFARGLLTQPQRQQKQKEKEERNKKYSGE